MSKPKKVSYRLIERDSAGKHLYKLLREMVRTHHDQLSDCRIALAWALSWNPDIDGRVVLGKMKRASDLDRELHEYDAIVLLNSDFKLDERGRKCYRMRKHDLEEFSEIVERHGLWKKDLEHFAAALRRTREKPLLPETDEEIAARVAANPNVRAAVEKLRPKAGSGIDSVSITAGGKTTTLRAKGSH